MSMQRRGMTFRPMFGKACQFNGERMVILWRWSVQWRENGITEVVSLMEREWSCYRGGQFNRGSMTVREVVSLMEGEWLCYGGGQSNGGSMVMLQKWSLQ